MGMEGKLRQISKIELDNYRKTPSKLYADLISKPESADLTRLTAATRQLQASPVFQRVRQRAFSGQKPIQKDLEECRQLARQLFAENQGAIADLESQHIGPSKDGRELSLHKSWHCLHFLLTGKSREVSNSLLGKAIMGGTEIPDRQGVMGHGPARYLTPAEVREVSKALSEFPIQSKAQAFDSAAAGAAKVYVPNHEREELVDYFNRLTSFYRAASENGNAVLLWVE